MRKMKARKVEEQMDLNTLEFWKLNEQKMPMLSKLAKAILGSTRYV